MFLFSMRWAGYKGVVNYVFHGCLGLVCTSWSFKVVLLALSGKRKSQIIGTMDACHAMFVMHQHH